MFLDHPGIWFRFGIAISALLLPLSFLPPSWLLLCPIWWLGAAASGLLAMDLSDGREPSLWDIWGELQPRLPALVSTGAWVVLSTMAWFVIPYQVAPSLGRSGQVGDQTLGLLLASWGAVGGYYLFASVVYALPAALVDRHSGPAATAASRRAWRAGPWRTLEGLVSALMMPGMILHLLCFASLVILLPLALVYGLMELSGVVSLLHGWGNTPVVRVLLQVLLVPLSVPLLALTWTLTYMLPVQLVLSYRTLAIATDAPLRIGPDPGAPGSKGGGE